MFVDNIHSVSSDGINRKFKMGFIMSAAIKYGLGFIILLAVFYYYQDEIVEFMAEPETQVSLGQALGVTRERDRVNPGNFWRE